MINVKDNYKNSVINIKCDICQSDDTTEYSFDCAMLQRLTQEEIKAINLESVDNMQELKYIQRVNIV